MIDFLLGAVPSWVWIALGFMIIAVIVGVLKGDGWKWAFAVAGAAALAFFQSRAHQRGAAAERIKQANADTKARETISENRAENLAKSDDELDREIERWTRP